MWPGVVEELRSDIVAGRQHWLTEDSLRRATANALVERAGIAAERVRFERRGLIAGGAVDLVVDDPLEAAIEFKFPRDSASVGAADTMTHGEMLKDFYRVAALPSDVDRWVVLLIHRRLRGYLERRADPGWCFDVGQTFELSAGLADRLPATAGRLIGAHVDASARFMCEFSFPVEELTLSAYRPF